MTIGQIDQKLGYSIEEMDLEADDEFFHPAAVLNKIFAIGNLEYKKKKGQIEALTSHIGDSDLTNLYFSGRCLSFNAFFDKISGL